MVFQHQHPRAEWHECHVDPDEHSGHQRRRVSRGGDEFARRHRQLECAADGPEFPADVYQAADQHRRGAGQQCRLYRDGEWQHPDELPVVFQHQLARAEWDKRHADPDEHPDHQRGQLSCGGDEFTRKRNQLQRHAHGPALSAIHHHPTHELHRNPGQQRRL